MGWQEDFEGIKGILDRMPNVKDGEKDGMLEYMMEQLGHKKSAVWQDAEPEGNGSTSLFGRKAASGGKGGSFQYPNG